MNCARSGSPGISTVLAKSPGVALLCGVDMRIVSFFIMCKFYCFSFCVRSARSRAMRLRQQAWHMAI